MAIKVKIYKSGESDRESKEALVVEKREIVFFSGSGGGQCRVVSYT